MRITQLTFIVLFLVGVIAVTVGCSAVQTSPNHTSRTLTLKQEENGNSAYADEVAGIQAATMMKLCFFLTVSCGVDGVHSS